MGHMGDKWQGRSMLMGLSLTLCVCGELFMHHGTVRGLSAIPRLGVIPGALASPLCPLESLAAQASWFPGIVAASGTWALAGHSVAGQRKHFGFGLHRLLVAAFAALRVVTIRYSIDSIDNTSMNQTR